MTGDYSPVGGARQGFVRSAAGVFQTFGVSKVVGVSNAGAFRLNKWGWRKKH